jgi:hypothetical protein
MKKIETSADFEMLLDLEKAIVFIFLEWSGSAHLSKRVVIEWENQTKLIIPLFEINPEDSDECSKWVYENDIHGHGYGSIVWLEKGKFLEFEKDAGKSGASGIERKTSKIFF